MDNLDRVSNKALREMVNLEINDERPLEDNISSIKEILKAFSVDSFDFEDPDLDYIGAPGGDY